MPDEMETLAKSCSIDHVAKYSQIEHLKSAPQLMNASDGQKGICYGLSFVWMEYKLKKSHDKFFEDLKSWPDKATFLKAAGIYNIVQQRHDSEDVAARTCGLVRAQDKEKVNGKNVFTDKIHDFDVTEKDEMSNFVNWLSAAVGERCFLILSDKHAMAASGSKAGKYSFFDPNFGVVTTRSSGNLKKFFSSFFAEQRIRKSYWKSSYRFDLKVQKFKKP